MTIRVNLGSHIQHLLIPVDYFVQLIALMITKF